MPDAKITITQSDKRLLAAGHFLTYDATETRLRLEYNNDHLDFIFVFVTDDVDRSTKISTQVLDPLVLKLTFVNFVSPFGTHNTEVMQIGTIGGAHLWLHYQITPLTGTKRYQVAYSFYTGVGE